ncbi:MAG TPA: hypothetical protein VIM77_09565, partial [Mucilaginibacter sp.]
MLGKTICIITQSHLCRNPRVLKEAIALVKEGYDVQILTGIISSDLYKQDLSAIQHYPNICLKAVFDLSKPTLRSFTDRLLNKLGRLAVKRLKVNTSLSLGYGALRYYRAAKAIEADLYICHQELSTYIGTRLLAQNFKIAFDFEDWYSEDLLPSAQTERPISLLKKTESIALNQAAFCITTSAALAKTLAETYGSPQPHVIYNVFPIPGFDLGDKAFKAPLKLFWFSQTIGPGRGLEEFVALLSSVKNTVELHLLGNVSAQYHSLLNSIFPKMHKLYLHELVEEKDLAKKIAGFDIGLALELDTPPSRNYTITNKLFQYIQSGLP